MQLQLNKDNWEKVTLGDIVYEPKETTKNIIKDGFQHIVGLEHIESGDIHLRNSFSNDTETTFSKVFRENDILFGRRRAYLKKAAQAKFDGVCSGDITVIRANDKVDIRLLPFIIHNDKFFDYAVKHSAGGLSPRVKFKDLANYEFLLPPKDQQAHFADLLWALDDVIEKDLRVLEKLENYKLSKSNVLESSLNKKISLSEIATITMGQSPDGKSYNELGQGIPFIQGNAEFSKDGPKNKLFTTSPTKIVDKNEILISVRAPVGDLNITNQKICIGRGLASVKLNNPNLNIYIFEYLKKEKNNIESQSSGSTFKSINKDILNNLKIPMGEEYSLNKILNFYQSCNLSIAQLESKIESSRTLQKALINQIF